MKKLNRKGFTLVELLAVIIILAIVVGITIPAVLTTVNNARTSARDSAVSAVADWIDRQYQACQIGDGTIASVDPTFYTACCTKTAASDNKITCDVSATLLNAAGVKADNFLLSTTVNKKTVKSTITINTKTGRSCVKLYINPGKDYRGDATVTYNGGIC